MSLKFTYNSNTYIYIPVSRTASTSVRTALEGSSDVTIDTAYTADIEGRRDPFVRTYNHITYDEATALSSTDGTETYFSVVRNPMHRAKSLYNYMRWRGWCADTTFDSYWTDIINNSTHEANVAPGAYTTRLQKDIVKTSGTIYKFETDLSQLETDFGVTLGTENEKPNVVSDAEYEAARTIIETHFNDDYVEFGYTKGT